MSLWDYEREQWNSGIQTVCGVDEAGAGPLAGPVYAAAVILPREMEIPGLNDSKKLTEKRRETLFPLIQQQAVAWAIATATPEEIDEINILNARMLAMARAIEKLDPPADFALIDGNRSTGIPLPHRTVVKGTASAPPSPPPPFWPR
jgi:ribonuclease HII